MSTQFKKYFFILFLISFLGSSYWYFFTAKWGAAITKEHFWKHSFQPKDVINFETINWKKSKQNHPISKENKTQNLVFQTEFSLIDFTKILEGTIEYEFRYSAKILINGKMFADINRSLITSSLEGNKIKIYEYWRPRKVVINYEFLQKTLKNGKNTITIIVYNVTDLKSLESNKKQLSFLSKGRSNQLKSNFKLQKPSSYFKDSSLPIFKIITNNKVIPDEPKINSALNIIANKSGENKLTGSTSLYDIKIERRGNTSQSFAKKSYSFNVYNQNKKKAAVELLNLPASKKWVLYGPYADKSLIRNALTYSLYNQMGNYAPRTQFINLVINDNYQGIYTLTEKIQISPKHINIAPLKIGKRDSSIFSGGYILEIDRNDWKSIYPPKKDTSSIPTSYMIYTPKKKKINTIVRDKIVSQYNSFEQHLYENDNIYDYLDINSFIDYLIITEFTKNIDGYCLSTFLYNKNINNSIPKFFIGPIWDYNFSLGLTNYHDGYNPEGYVYNSSKYIPFWWKKLLSNNTFKSALEKRYFELLKTVLSNNNINNAIDSLSNICLSAKDDNFNKWPVLNSVDFWPNHYLGKTYKDEIDYLKSWIKKRLSFLDNDLLAKDKKGVKYFEISIRNNEKWLKEIKLKAKERNISIDEMISIDAKHMAKKE